MKKETTFILVGLALIRVGFGVAWRATEKATVKNDDTDASLNLESTLFFLRNLSWLRYLASVKRSTLSTKPVPSSSKKTIPRQSLQKLRPHKPLSLVVIVHKFLTGRNGMVTRNCISIAAMGFLNLWMSAPVVSGKKLTTSGILVQE